MIACEMREIGVIFWEGGSLFKGVFQWDLCGVSESNRWDGIGSFFLGNDLVVEYPMWGVFWSESLERIGVIYIFSLLKKKNSLLMKKMESLHITIKILHVIQSIFVDINHLAINPFIFGGLKHKITTCQFARSWLSQCRRPKSAPICTES